MQPNGGHWGRQIVWGPVRIDDDKRSVLHSQEARPDTLALDADKLRQIEIGLPQFAGYDRAETRMHDAARRGIAGVQEIGSPAVVALLAGHGANERQLLADAGDLLPMLGNGDAGHRRRDSACRTLCLRSRLGVERLELTGTASHPKQDTSLARLT